MLDYDINAELSVAKNRLLPTFTLTIVSVVSAYISYLVYLIIYNLYFHPLAKFPGPKAFAATPIPYVVYQVTGRLPFMYKGLHNACGDVVRVLPNEVSFNCSEAWRDIYNVRDGHKIFTKDPKVVFPSDEGIYNILSTPNVADHARYRRTLNPAFSERALRGQEPLVMKYVDLLMSRLHKRCKEGPQDMVTWFTLVTFDIIADLTFGESLHGLETETQHPWVLGLFGSTMKFSSLKRAIRNFPHISPLLNAFIPNTLVEQRIKHAAFVREQVEKRVELMEDRHDFMSYILPYKEAEASMSLAEVRENYGALMIAGSENVATTMEFTLYHLLKHPNAYSKLVQEIRKTFQKEQDIGFATVNRLKYLAAVLNEAMRIQPAAPSSQPRVVPEEGANIAGIFVPGGTRVSVPPLSMNHDPRYFKDPTVFSPERWLDEIHSEPCDRTAFQPFGIGPRSCAGRNLAIAEIKLILARLFWNFDMVLPEEYNTWGEKLNIYHLWEITPLYVRLTPTVGIDQEALL